MRSRILVGAFLLVAILPIGSIATMGIEADPLCKWAVINLPDPIRIGGAFAFGPVLFEHDHTRMARGEPCTVVYQFVPGKGRGDKIVSFHCKPRWGAAVDRFALATGRDALGHRVLVEYQFAGDTEAHGVPTTTR